MPIAAAVEALIESTSFVDLIRSIIDSEINHSLLTPNCSEPTTKAKFHNFF